MDWAETTARRDEKFCDKVHLIVEILWYLLYSLVLFYNMVDFPGV